MNKVTLLLFILFNIVKMEYVSAQTSTYQTDVVTSVPGSSSTLINSTPFINSSITPSVTPFITAATRGKNSSALPRFASIKFNEVNTRTGPTVDSPIEWVFIKKGEPVEITAEYGKWRKIKDINGEGGWTHVSTLSGKRFVVLVSKDITPLFKSPENHAKIIAKLSPDIRCALIKCSQEWCNINCDSYKGWIKKNILWGVYNDE